MFLSLFSLISSPSSFVAKRKEIGCKSREKQGIFAPWGSRSFFFPCEIQYARSGLSHMQGGVEELRGIYMKALTLLLQARWRGEGGGALLGGNVGEGGQKVQL